MVLPVFETHVSFQAHNGAICQDLKAQPLHSLTLGIRMAAFPGFQQHPSYQCNSGSQEALAGLLLQQHKAHGFNSAVI